MIKIGFYQGLFALLLSTATLILSPVTLLADEANWSVARQWNEELLEAIRKDFARPTVHARNLYHVSAAMWDAWAAYDDRARTLQHHEHLSSNDIQAARDEAISYASYRLLMWRFANSPGAAQSLPAFDARMNQLGYDKSFTSTQGNSPAALGNRIAETYIQYGLGDNSNEAGGFANLFYEPVNDPLLPALPGNPDISDPNRWQPLALDFFVDQGGNVIVGGYPGFLSPEWGTVKAFALSPQDLTIYQRAGHEYWVYHDPGPPPQLGGIGDAQYKAGFEQVVLWSGLLDPADGVMIDISPASNGNNTLGTNDGSGYVKNPATGLPYTPEIVPAGDYYRVLAEFWADGPASETPPGHWFTIANYVSDHPMVVKRMGGKGPVLDDLEWDVKLYLTLGGTMHDVAVTAWGIKGLYDFTRPVSAIRYMCDRGQSSDPQGPSYHPDGISLYPDAIEVITAATAAPGGKHFGLGGNLGQHLGKIAVRAWRGPNYVANPATDTAGVGWIRCADWWPYQRPSFVTPPFAGYVSGHSAFSRAAAVIMSTFTGDEFFPGGMGVFEAPKDEFLVFEDGPSVDITLQWAKYYDASDETSLSRIYGGIHPPADDIPGRIMGVEIAKDAFRLARDIFNQGNDSNRATFEVSKKFTDGANPGTIDVTLSCTTGLPLTQTQTISESQGVKFVVTSFDDKQLDCSVSENLENLSGYTPSYLATGPGEPNSTNGCHFSNTEDGAENFCHITNNVNPVKVTIEKEWIFDGSTQPDINTHYRLTLYCDAQIIGGEESCPYSSGTNQSAAGNGQPLPAVESCIEFESDKSSVFIARVTPHWPASHCRVVETVFDDAVEIANGCESLLVKAGQEDSCQITNTVFYEGIPGMNRYGMAILILLMLGMGMLGYRRIS